MSSDAIIVVSPNIEKISVPEPGLHRQVMAYDPSLMLVHNHMEKGWVGARHSHPHEQMVYVVKGRLVFEYPGGKFEAGAGDNFIVSGNVEHQASALEDSEVLDIFTPMREDYAAQ
jgi:quercetin dioxygenase-like cupin family protein